MHRNLDKILSQLVEEIERTETTRRSFGSVINRIKKDIDLASFPAIASNVPERTFTKKLSHTSLAGLRIAGVDGGLVRKKFGSIDLILTRGIAVVFEFRSGDGPEVDFFPDPFPLPDVQPVRLSLSNSELDQLASLERVASELRVALNVLNHFDTDLILMDGSLLYHPRDRPSNTSPVYEKFEEVMALYRQLYNKSIKSKTTLVGVVKDSRSTRLVNILGDILPHIIRQPLVFEMMQGIDYRWLLRVSRDCDLLDTFLEEGERTFAFNYSMEITQATNALDDDILSWATQIWITYLKTAREDVPLRIEILADRQSCVEKLDRAIQAILPLACGHPEYGVPTPIVEADVRARISSHESQLIIDRLMALTGLTLTSIEKRRSRNPFGG